MNQKQFEEQLHLTIGDSFRVLWEIDGPLDHLKRPVFKLVAYDINGKENIIVQYWKEERGFQAYLQSQDDNRISKCFDNIKAISCKQ